MSNHFPQILQQYLSEYQFEKNNDSSVPWVLASLIEKHGSSYRNAGALMMVSPSGEALGGLSGGCLEREIIQQAYQCSVEKVSRTVIYDTHDPDDNFLRHQTGCQGLIHVLFTPIDSIFHQQLCEVYAQIKQGQVQFLALSTEPEAQPASLILAAVEVNTAEMISNDCLASYQTINNKRYSVIQVNPIKRLLVAGGGYDAEPLVKMAKDIGWHVSVWDDRLHYAKASKFKYADQIIRFSLDDEGTLKKTPLIESFDAVVLMTHHLGKDAAWLSYFATNAVDTTYIGMIGPMKRQAWVAEICRSEYGVVLDPQWLQQRVHSPAGFDIGGDTPESIALSILAQAHQQLLK